MKTALILPIPNLTLAAGRSYHLILNHLLDSLTYRLFYTVEALNGGYVILDNSAHEHGSGGSISTILQNGQKLKAKEIVLPDTLFDADVTIDRISEAMDFILTEGSEVYSEYQPRLSLVAQGSTYPEWVRCFNALLRAYLYRKDRFDSLGCPGITFSVSKDYDTMGEFPGGLKRMLEEHVLPASTEFGFPIHLLGWGRALHNYQPIAREYGHLIRSIDSAKPIVYGLNGILLDETQLHKTPEYPKRSPSFFFDAIPLERMSAVIHNIDVFDTLAGSEGSLYVRPFDEVL